MGICFGWFLDLPLLFGALLICWYIYFKKVTSRYWAKRNVPHADPVFIVGNGWKGRFSESPGFMLAKRHLMHKEKKLLGSWIFNRPTLAVFDYDIIKNILVRDFNYFHDRGITFNEEREPLSGHLFNIEGAKWRNLRVKLTPTFTSGKMKMMFPIIVECGEILQTYLEQRKDVEEPIEIKDLLARFTTDTISSCAFGIETNSINNPDSEFRKYGKKVFETTLRLVIVNTLSFAAPAVSKFLQLRQLPEDVSNFFLNIVKETIHFRESKNVNRNDFMQLLIQLKNKGRIEDVDSKTTDDEPIEEQKFSVNQAAAQAFVFFAAGFETSSTTMMFTFYELALNPDIQRRLQKEIDRVLENSENKFTYDGANEMEYLDWVVQETLRKYPPVPALFRTCTKDYEIPGMNTSIEKGTPVIISLLGLQHDPDVFPDPERFDPERFSPEQRTKRSNFANLPFGEGPRICIGNRFALLQTKVGIVSILSKFDVHVSDKTAIPLVYDNRSFILSPVGGMPLRLIPRKS